MTIKIPIFKSCLLAASLAQFTCSLSAEIALALFNSEMFKPEAYGIQDDLVKKQVNNLKDQYCIEVKIPNSPNSLFFPVEGIQPTTEEAGLYSGARNIEDKAITSWYIKIFQEKFTKTENANNAWKTSFTNAFRKIASDPVGRVLLYRLIIECTRLDITNMDKPFNCCAQDIIIPTKNIADRKNCCRLQISTDPKSDMAFSPRGILFFNLTDTSGLNVFTKKTTQTFDTFEEETFPLDIGLFHEMLHWFHFLQHPTKFINANKKEANVFKYPFRCYYGDATDIITWHSAIRIDAEEIATILGCPHYNNEEHIKLIPLDAFLMKNKQPTDIETRRGYIPASDKFLNGEDLSENTYRLSRSKNAKEKCYLRFGHNSECIDETDIYEIPQRYELAHKVAIDCYKEITGQHPTHWNLIPGQAIQK